MYPLLLPLYTVADKVLVVVPLSCSVAIDTIMLVDGMTWERGKEGGSDESSA